MWLLSRSFLHRIAGLLLLFNATIIHSQPLQGGSPQTIVTTMVRDIDSYACKLANDDVFSGQVYISHEGNCAYSLNIGNASESFNIKNSENTPISFGDCSFFYAAVALLQLIEDGKANFNDALATYLPSNTKLNIRVADITLLHLLTRSSGISDCFNTGWTKKNMAQFSSLESYKKLLQRSKQLYPPGDKWHPTGAEGVLLAIAIEKIVRMPFYEYMNTYFFPRSGLKNTSYPLLFKPTRVATGYNTGPFKRNNLFARPARGAPHSGCYTTAYDVSQFFLSLREFKIIGKQMLQRVFTPYIKIAHPEISGQITSPYTLQGLGITLIYKDVEVATSSRRVIQALSYGVLHPQGIPITSKSGYLATLTSASEFQSAAVDLYEDSYITSVVLSNYGQSSLKANFPPAALIQGKIRRSLQYNKDDKDVLFSLNKKK